MRDLTPIKVLKATRAIAFVERGRSQKPVPQFGAGLHLSSLCGIGSVQILPIQSVAVVLLHREAKRGIHHHCEWTNRRRAGEDSGPGDRNRK